MYINNMKSRNKVLDVAKGFAILNIIFIHTVFWSGESYVPPIIRSLSLLVDVPLFFFLSGWAASIGKSTFHHVIKQVVKILIMYAIMLIFLALLSSIISKSFVPFGLVLKWFSFSNGYSNDFPAVMGSMWFLSNYLVIAITIPFLSKVSSNEQLSNMILIVLILINSLFSFTGIDIQNYSIYQSVTLKYFFFYTLFYFLGMTSTKKSISLKELCGTCLILFVPFYLYLYYLNFNFDLQLNKFPPNMFYFISSLFSITLVLYFKSFENLLESKSKNNIFIKFLEYSGKNVFTIFLYQGFGATVIYFLVPILTDNFNWIFTLFICLICNMLVTYLLVMIFSKVNYSVTNYILSSFEIMQRRVSGNIPAVKKSE